MPAKRTPQTEEQMMELEKRRSSESTIYRRESAEFVDTRIANNVRTAAAELRKMSTTPPVSLTDTSRVISITLDYMDSCASAGTVPSVAGLCRALGIARSTFYDCVNRQSPKSTALWFQKVHDTFADLLSAASLRNEVNVVSSIFLLKALYQFRDTSELVIKQPDSGPLGEQAEVQALMEKYGDIPED